MEDAGSLVLQALYKFATCHWDHEYLVTAMKAIAGQFSDSGSGLASRMVNALTDLKTKLAMVT